MKAHKNYIYMFCLAQLFFWTLIPAMIFPNTPLDVNEGFMWGQTWQLGYYKHPPLQAWLLEVTYQLFGTHPIGYFLTAQLTIVTGILGVYATALRLTDERKAVLSTLALSGVYYFNYTSLEFNPNTLLLAIWPWACYWFVRVIGQGRQLDWIMMVVLTVVGAYAKYFSIVLALSFTLYIVVTPSTRAAFKTAKPYWAFGLGCALLLPHLLWLNAHDFMPFQYALNRGDGLSQSFLSKHLFAPIGFGLQQVLAGVLAWLMIAVALRFQKAKVTFGPLFAIAFFPLMLTILMAMVTGLHLRTMWGVPLISFIPLYLIHHHTGVLGTLQLKHFARATTVVFLIGLLALSGMQMSGKGFSRMNFDGRMLAKHWQSQWPYPHPPYAIVGSHWLAGNASFYSASRPRVLINGGFNISPWISPDEIKKKGAVVILEASDQNDLAWAGQGQVTWQQPIEIKGQPYKIGFVAPESVP